MLLSSADLKVRRYVRDRRGRPSGRPAV